MTPPAVTTTAATEVGLTGATLNGTVNPNGSTTTAFFQYGLTTGYGLRTGDQDLGAGTAVQPVSAVIGGLQCNTPYHFRAVASNAGGPTNGADQTFTTTACPVALVAAVLPLSRFSTLGSGTLPTAFAAIINAGSAVAVNCRLAAPASPPAGLGTFIYQTVDSNNVPIGTPNTPADIAPGDVQGFVFGFAPTATIPAGTSLAMRFLCDNVAAADEIVGVNNLFIGASATPSSDPVALLATISGDSVMRIPGSSGAQLAAAGVSNVGATAVVTVTADTGGVQLPVTLLVCETNGVGACLTGFTPSVTVTHLAGTGRTYAIAAIASGSIPFLPAVNRVFLRITEGGVGGPLHGATAAAICTTPNLGC